MDLTKRQQEIYDFIRKYSAKYGYPPTVRDIGKAVGLASSSTVHAHLATRPWSAAWPAARTALTVTWTCSQICRRAWGCSGLGGSRLSWSPSWAARSTWFRPVTSSLGSAHRLRLTW